MIRKNTNIGKFKEIIVAVFDSVSPGVFRVFLRVLRPMRAKKGGKKRGIQRGKKNIFRILKEAVRFSGSMFSQYPFLY